jgi:hypothetical protein
LAQSLSNMGQNITKGRLESTNAHYSRTNSRQEYDRVDERQKKKHNHRSRAPTQRLGPKLSEESVEATHGKERLCYFYTRINFEKMFVQQKQARENPPREINMDILVLKEHTYCPFCRLILSFFEKNDDLDSLECVSVRGITETLNFVPRLWLVGLDKTQSLANPSMGSELWHFWMKKYTYCIQLRDLNSVSAQSSPLPESSRAEREPKRQIEMSSICEWISICEGSHTSCGKAPRVRLESGFTLRVIDVDQGCIIEAEPGRGDRYIALSYVWGGVQQLQLSRSNYNLLTQPGSITSSTTQVPRTIQDAIILCKGISEKYLWCDSLCIIQDAPEDRNIQIMNMNHIYSHALLTLVAASGSNANAGLPGVRLGSASIQDSQRINGLELIPGRSDLWPLIKSSTWFTRGWTFQEYVLSKRLLFVVSGAVVFLCQKALFREDAGLNSIPSERKRYLLCGMGHISPTMSASQASKRYRDLISAYSFRELTNDYDILNAFAGISKALSPVLGSFLSGLPEENICTALLWRNTASRIGNNRREKFPSWSWSGWKHGSPVKIRYVFFTCLEY